MGNRSGTIVYIGGFEMPDRNAAAHRVLNNAKIFHALGFHVVFCGIDKQIEKVEYVPQKIGAFDSIPSIYPKNAMEWLAELLRFEHIRRVIEMYDDVQYVIAYNMHAKPLDNLERYCKKRNIPVIADVTEWYENPFSLHPVRFVRWIDTHSVMTKLQKKVDGMIVISAWLENYYRTAVNSMVRLPPLVDIQEPIWDVPDEERTGGVSFVYSGVTGRDKDRINLIIEAFYALRERDFTFTVIGITRADFLKDYPELEYMVEALKEKVLFRGRVSHEESIRSLYRADYCVFIRERSRKNMAGFPTKFAECVTSGIGVVANDVSNIKDYFPLPNSLLIDEVCTEKLVCALSDSMDRGKIVHCKSDAFDYRNYIGPINALLRKMEE